MSSIIQAKTTLILALILAVGCESIQQPKPKALLRLQYPEPQYSAVPNTYPFDFEYNNWGPIERN